MNLLFEAKYASRQLAKSPGNTALSILLVALSLCVGIVSIALVYNIAIAPLGYKNSNRWVAITIDEAGKSSDYYIDSFSHQHFQYISNNQTVFSEIGAIAPKSRARISNGLITTRVTMAEISPNIFAAAGLKPLLGRSLQSSDAVNENAVVLSFPLWKNFFSSDPAIVGKQIQLNDKPYTVVGVMKSGTSFGTQHDIWVSRNWARTEAGGSDEYGLTLVGVLRAGITKVQAEKELKELTDHFRKQHPTIYQFWNDVDVKIYPFKMFLMQGNVPILIAIAIVAAVVVLLGTINLANIFLSRMLERQQELAVRNCMGSSTFRLFQYSLIESFITCLAGLLIAIPIVVVAMQSANHYLRDLGKVEGFGLQTPPRWLLESDASTIGVATAVLLTVWIVCGIWPALKLRVLDISTLFVSGTKGSVRQFAFRTTQVLVAFQIVAACFLLIVSGSLYFSVRDFLTRDYGIAVNNRYIVEIELPSNYQTLEQRLGFINTVEDELRKNNNVADAAIVNGIPYFAGLSSYAVPDRGIGNRPPYPVMPTSMFSPEAFKIFGIDIIEGRNFEDSDITDRTGAVIVDEKFARDTWPGESAVGKTIQIGPEGGGFAAPVVGVARQSVFGVFPATNFQASALFFARYGLVGGQNFFQVVLVSKGSPTDAKTLDIVRQAVSKVDRSVAVFAPRSMREHLDSSTALYRMVANIFVVVGLATVLIAAIGIFAITSRSVIQQKHVIGIRRALGSSNSNVLLIYLKQGLSYLLIGMVVGGSAALLANNALSKFVATLVSFTPLVTLLVIVGLGLLIAAATIWPAKKILKSEPGDALHQV